MRLLDALVSRTRLWHVVALYGTACGGGALLWSFGPHAQIDALGLADTMPDAMPFSSGSDVLAWVAALTHDGLAAYRAFLVVDLVHGPLLPLAFAATLLRWGGPLRPLALAALAAAAADMAENTLLLTLLPDSPSHALSARPGGLALLAAFAAACSSAKLMALAPAALATLVTAARPLLRTVGRRLGRGTETAEDRHRAGMLSGRRPFIRS